ncbi:two-component response regulator ORR23-like [Gastrolobium bilobum]|uniref:two-component response regulator ORR23-like n=1 Tax=Gastrolobium bilobum TaxID=150636 RepID=UPI002AB0B703|nr:two-component response regulator ORR23-like [Gastrolobium bilobum]
MTLENYLIDEDGVGDHFPVGMRVLLVDDDQLCLKVLGNMLRKCQYQVTTTIQSIKALDMLRTNRNMFDLVITGVNMPHMDGLKLLEIVGHEMDIPVIMLSELSDIEYVKKSVILGACDYIIKPPRIQVLQNIWQHIARRKIDCKGQITHFNEEKACNIAREGSQSITLESNADHNQMHGKKRKEPCVEEENGEMNAKENEEPSNQKKPRLNWNDDLQRKFLAAVNSLGIDSEFTCLLNTNLAASRRPQQACMVAASRCSDSYVQMNSIDRYGNFDTLFGSRRIGPSAPVQSIETQNINNSRNIQPCMFSANQSSSLSQGIPNSIEFNQFQQSNCITSFEQFSSIDGSNGYVVSSNFPGSITQSTKVDKSYLDAGMKSNDAYILQPQEELTEEDIFGTLHDIVSDIG